jgi:peptidoglycan/xylan/chitin deacetylase (PgdA/CDA1 family)
MPAARVKHVLRKSMMAAARAASWFAGERRGARIVTYHSVGHRKHEMNVHPDRFREQIEWLSEHAEVVSLERAIHTGIGTAITFDDGYLDNLTNAAPLLKPTGFPATVFVVAGRAGSTLTHDCGDPGASLMSFSEMIELSDCGFEIGSHTLTHPHLTDLPPQRQEEEIRGSKRLIEDRLQRPVTSFAYPYGSVLDYSSETRALVIAAGYSLAVSNRFGPHAPGSDMFAVQRICIHANDSIETFADKMSGRLDALSFFETRAMTHIKKSANRVLGV